MSDAHGIPLQDLVYILRFYQLNFRFCFFFKTLLQIISKQCIRYSFVKKLQCFAI